MVLSSSWNIQLDTCLRGKPSNVKFNNRKNVISNLLFCKRYWINYESSLPQWWHTRIYYQKPYAVNHSASNTVVILVLLHFNCIFSGRAFQIQCSTITTVSTGFVAARRHLSRDNRSVLVSKRRRKRLVSSRYVDLKAVENPTEPHWRPWLEIKVQLEPLEPPVWSLTGAGEGVWPVNVVDFTSVLC